MILLSAISAEIDQPIGALAARLDGAVHFDDIGMRVVTRETAAAVITEHHAALQAAQDRDRAARGRLRAESTAEATRQHVRAVQASQRNAGLQLDSLDMPAAALALITQQDTERHMDSANRRTAALMAGESTGAFYQIRSPKE